MNRKERRAAKALDQHGGPTPAELKSLERHGKCPTHQPKQKSAPAPRPFRGAARGR